MKKIKLQVLGLSYSQTQTGAYVLVLSEGEGKRRIPIIIGGFEAQAIAIELEKLKPSRPLTHDLFVNFATAFKIDLVEVNINRIVEGIFYSELLCDSGGSRIKLDARTSDAVALAIRFGCPIYTTEDVLRKTGVVLTKSDEYFTDKSDENMSYSKHTIEDLNKMLEKAIKEENYEEASTINKEIKKRKSNK